jgi:hypothetical protein
MSGTIPPTGPEVAVTMSLAEWQIVYDGICNGLTIRAGQVVAAKLQQQVGMAMQRMRANGQLPEGAQEQP